MVKASESREAPEQTLQDAQATARELDDLHRFAEHLRRHRERILTQDTNADKKDRGSARRAPTELASKLKLASTSPFESSNLRVVNLISISVPPL